MCHFVAALFLSARREGADIQICFIHWTCVCVRPSVVSSCNRYIGLGCSGYYVLSPVVVLSSWHLVSALPVGRDGVTNKMTDILLPIPLDIRVPLYYKSTTFHFPQAATPHI